MSIVITRLIGGLGNQMFQYAVARAVALRHDAVLKLDISGFADYPLRRYELDHFPIIAKIATDTDLSHFGIRPIKQYDLQHRLRRWITGKDWPVYREPHFNYDPLVMQLSSPIYLDGYWQSEKYFNEFAQILRKEFTPLSPLESENLDTAKLIASVNSVSLHIRRGDYVSNSHANQFHGICTLDYYHAAIKHIAGLVSSPHFFVFSDEIDWAQANLHCDFPMTFINANPPERGFRDMQLMSHCRHHIVANSSFSWWGAWLNPSQENIVVAPKSWFNSDLNTCDLLPDAWTRL